MSSKPIVRPVVRPVAKPVARPVVVPRPSVVPRPTVRPATTIPDNEFGLDDLYSQGYLSHDDDVSAGSELAGRPTVSTKAYGTGKEQVLQPNLSQQITGSKRTSRMNEESDGDDDDLSHLVGMEKMGVLPSQMGIVPTKKKSEMFQAVDALTKQITATPNSRPVAITKHGLRQFVESSQGIRLFIQNCVASCDLNCTPDLEKIAVHCRNAEYNPRRFCALIMKLRNPNMTTLVFSSGKIVITGGKSEEDCLLTARKVCSILLKLGMPASINQFRIQNIVSTGDCGFPIRLEGLAIEHDRASSVCLGF